MCCRSTNIVKSLKLLTLPYPFSKNQLNNIILATNCSYVISPCVTNNNNFIKLIINNFIAYKKSTFLT